MSKLKAWCNPADQHIKKHRLTVLSANPAKLTAGVEALAKEVPNHYSSAKRVAGLLKRLGKEKAAKYVEQKLPIAATSRSGDVGEILATMYVAEFTSYSASINRLRWKDHREMAMRGEDIIAVEWNASAGLKILKGESKSNASLSTATVTNARAALKHSNGRPTPHALSFLADRLHELGDHDLGNQVDDAQLSKGIKLGQMAHMLFTFSGNDPTNFLKADLTSYAGKIQQYSVGIMLKGHQKFIKGVFDKVIANGVKP
jgi:hypothetical protein